MLKIKLDFLFEQNIFTEMEWTFSTFTFENIWKYLDHILWNFCISKYDSIFFKQFSSLDFEIFKQFQTIDKLNINNFWIMSVFLFYIKNYHHRGKLKESEITLKRKNEILHKSKKRRNIYFICYFRFLCNFLYK